MQLARYEVVEKGKVWAERHDGRANGEYATKETSTVAAAEIAITQGKSFF